MQANKIRVLVVDDSQLIRELICDSLGKHSDIVVAGVASDGRQAIELVARLKPDIVTLDLQMPRMDGLTTLDHMLANQPVPVIVVSSLTQRAADVTMQALQRGALDYIAKPTGIESMERAFGDELPTKIRNMAGADVRRILQYRKSRDLRTQAVSKLSTSLPMDRFATGCVAIGISTGGPPALSSLFGSLLPPLPPVVVVQHMPQLFTGPFASRLNSLSSLTVKEAAAGDVLQPNHAYVAPGGIHLSLRRSGNRTIVDLSDGDFVSGHKPSVDVMMKSAAEIFGKQCVGVIMTGMGRDGADGCRAIRSTGGFVLGQDEQSSDVYGMNKVAFVEGNVDKQMSLDQIAEAMATEVRKRCTTGRSNLFA